jgi:hypothetical protein
MRETLCHMTSKSASRWGRVANCSCERVNVSHISCTFLYPHKKRSFAKITYFRILRKCLYSVRQNWKKMSRTLSIGNRGDAVTEAVNGKRNAINMRVATENTFY